MQHEKHLQISYTCVTRGERTLCLPAPDQCQAATLGCECIQNDCVGQGVECVSLGRDEVICASVPEQGNQVSTAVAYSVSFGIVLIACTVLF